MSINNPEVLKELSKKITESVKKISLIKESFIFLIILKIKNLISRKLVIGLSSKLKIRA